MANQVTKLITIIAFLTLAACSKTGGADTSTTSVEQQQINKSAPPKMNAFVTKEAPRQ